ncbi:MAG: hypothetical protein ACPGKO_03250, partial [Pseudohongiellaceae bacterium]
SEKKVSLNSESKKPRTSACSGFLFLKHSKLPTVIDNTFLLRTFCYKAVLKLIISHLVRYISLAYDMLLIENACLHKDLYKE